MIVRSQLAIDRWKGLGRECGPTSGQVHGGGGKTTAPALLAFVGNLEDDRCPLWRGKYELLPSSAKKDQKTKGRKIHDTRE